MANGGAPLRRGRGRRVLVVVAVLLAGVAFFGWWTWPTNRLTRELDRIDLPAGARQTHEVANAEGMWLLDCFDTCSETTRHYTTTLGERETAEALVAALRARGYEVDGAKPCAEDRPRQVPAYGIGNCAFSVNGQGDGFNASARVGPRGDGAPGFSLAVSISG